MPASHRGVLPAFLPDATRRGDLFSLLLHSFLLWSEAVPKPMGENVWMVICNRFAPYTLPLSGGSGSQRAKGPTSSRFALRLLNARLVTGHGQTSNMVM